MKKIFAILTFWALAGMVSCSNEPEVVNPEEGVKTYELGIATDETRVEYNDGGEDGNTHKYRWEKGDDLAVWYSVNGVGSYSAIEKPFVASIVETGKPVVFFTSATNHDQMTKGEKYDYIAMYPYPTSVNGTEVTYTIGTETAEGAYTQKKAYEADYQILRATGENLIAMTDGRPTLSEYKQMMTTLQFYVNSENSKGAYTNIQITELQIYFPEAVTGVLTIDAKTGEIKSATSDRVDVEMSSDVMLAYETRQAARQADDYVNVVCKPFTMQAYNTATPAENRIVINVIGKGKNTTSGVTETISQSIFKTVSAAKEFKAADVIAMRLDLTDDWITTDYVCLPSSNKSMSWGDIAMSSEKFSTPAGSWNENIWIYHSYIRKMNDGTMAIWFDNRFGSIVHSTSMFAIATSDLGSYNTGSTLIVEFDAYAVLGDNDEYCPLHISTSGSTGGLLEEWGNSVTKIQQVNITNANSTNAVHIAQSNYSSASYNEPATDGEWVHYSVTLRDISVQGYLVLRVDGSLGSIFGTGAPKRACWVKNLRFSYQQN